MLEGAKALAAAVKEVFDAPVITRCQLYFILEGLLDRLIYLGYGLASFLALIGVKLVLHPLHRTPCRSSTMATWSRWW